MHEIFATASRPRVSAADARCARICMHAKLRAHFSRRLGASLMNKVEVGGGSYRQRLLDPQNLGVSLEALCAEMHAGVAGKATFATEGCLGTDIAFLLDLIKAPAD